MWEFIPLFFKGVCSLFCSREPIPFFLFIFLYMLWFAGFPVLFHLIYKFLTFDIKKTTSLVHVVLHYMTDFKTRSSQIYLWKALLIKQNSKMKNVVGRIWHNIHDKNNRERKRHRWPFGRQCNQRLSIWTLISQKKMC
jgi:hypothetical protein